MNLNFHDIFLIDWLIQTLQIEENTKILELGQLRASAGSTTSLDSSTALRYSPALGTEKRPTSGVGGAGDQRPPSRDKAGARKALLQWAQAAAKQQVYYFYFIWITKLIHFKFIQIIKLIYYKFI